MTFDEIMNAASERRQREQETANTYRDILNAAENRKKREEEEGRFSAFSILRSAYERGTYQMPEVQEIKAPEFTMEDNWADRTSTWQAKTSGNDMHAADLDAGAKDLDERGGNLEAIRGYLDQLERNAETYQMRYELGRSEKDRAAWESTVGEYQKLAAEAQRYARVYGSLTDEFNRNVTEEQQRQAKVQGAFGNVLTVNGDGAQSVTGTGADILGQIRVLEGYRDEAASDVERAYYRNAANTMGQLITEGYAAEPRSTEEAEAVNAWLDGRIRELAAAGMVKKVTSYSEGVPIDVYVNQTEIDRLEAMKKQNLVAGQQNGYTDRMAAETEKLPEELRAELLEVPGLEDELEAVTYSAAEGGGRWTAEATEAANGARSKIKAVKERLTALGYDDEQAEALLDYARREANAEATKAAVEEERERAAEGTTLGNWVTNIGEDILGGVGVLDLAAQNITAKKNPFTGERTPVDYNSNMMMLSNLSNATMQGQQEHVEKKLEAMGLDKGTVEEKAQRRMNTYQLTMSMGESAVVAGLSAMGMPATTVILGSSAATKTVMDCHERGLGDGAALLTGLAAGIAEVLTEQVSLGSFLEMVETGNARTLKNWAVNMLKQAGTEGLEEVSADIVNTMADVMINGDRSELRQSIFNYTLHGDSEEEARRKATGEWMLGTLKSFAGGAASGLCFGLAGSAINTVARSADRKSAARTAAIEILNDPAALRVYEEANGKLEGTGEQKLKTVQETMLNAVKRLDDLNNAAEAVEERTDRESARQGRNEKNPLEVLRGRDQDVFNEGGRQYTVTATPEGIVARIVENGERVYTETFGTRAKAVNALEAQRGKLMEQDAAGEIGGAMAQDNVQASAEDAGTAAAETQQGDGEGVRRDEGWKPWDFTEENVAETQQTGAELAAPMGDTMVTENAENGGNLRNFAENGQNNAEAAQETAEAEAEEKRKWEPRNEAKRAVLEILSGPVSNAQANRIMEDAALREAYGRMTGESLTGSKSEMRSQIKGNGESFYSDNAGGMRYNADINNEEGVNNGRGQSFGTGSQRGLGLDTDAVSSAVEEASGRNSGGPEGGERTSAFRRSEAGRRRSACRAFGQELKSTNDLGLLWGTDKKDLTVFQYGDSEEISAFIDDDEELSKVVSKAKSEGANVYFCVGAIGLNIEGTDFPARGVTHGNGDIWIQIDNVEMSPMEIYDHETGHDIIDISKVRVTNELKAALCEGMSEKEIKSMLARYASNYDGISLKNKRLLVEILCDTRAGVGEMAHRQEAVRAAFDKLDAEIRRKNGGGSRYSNNNDVKNNQSGISENRGLIEAVKTALQELGLVKPEQKQSYSFAGRNSQTADTEQLERAREMLEAGEDTEAIRRETGWFKGKDGEWRYEIDDSKAVYDPTGENAFAAEHPEYARYNELNSKLLYGEMTREEFAELRELDEKWREEKVQLQYRLNNGEATLRDVMHHEGLYRAYPDIARTRVVFAEMKKGVRGSYNPITNTITVNSEYRNKTEEAMAILMHEVQHRIQKAEGFASGASPSYWNREETYDRARQQVEGNRGRTLLHLSEEERNEYHEYYQLNREMDEMIETGDFAAEGSDRYDELEARSDELYAKLYPEDWFQKLLTYDHLLEDPQALVDYAYSHTAGEEEARNAADRRNMTVEERKNSPPKIGDENTLFADERELEAKTIGLTKNNKPFVDVTEDILSGVPQDKWAGTVADNLKTKFPNGITIGSNDIVIDKQSRGEMTHSKYTKWLKNNYPQRYADKLRATNNADEILIAADNWINEPPKHVRKDSIIDFARGKVFIRVGGTEYIADVVVGTQRNGKMKLYDVLQMTPASFMQIETNAATADNPSPGGRRNTTLISDDRVAQTDTDVKTENADLPKYTSAAEMMPEGLNEYGINSFDAMRNGKHVRVVLRQSNGAYEAHMMRFDEMAIPTLGTAQGTTAGEALEKLDREVKANERGLPTREDLREYEAERYNAALEERRMDSDAVRESYTRAAGKEEFGGTEATREGGVKVSGSLVANWSQTEALRAQQGRLKGAKDNVRQLERYYKAGKKMKDFARMVSDGTITIDEVPMDLNKAAVQELADAYSAERIADGGMMEQRHMVKRKADVAAAELLGDSESYSPQRKGILKQFSKAIMNERTPKRVLRQVFGEDMGARIYNWAFRPMYENNAEAKRWKMKQMDDVREIADGKGRKRQLTQTEKAYTQQMVEGIGFEMELQRMEGLDRETVDAHLNNFRERLELQKRTDFDKYDSAAQQVLDGTKGVEDFDGLDKDFLEECVANRAAAAELGGLNEHLQKIVDGNEWYMQMKAAMEADQKADRTIIQNAAKIYSAKYESFWKIMNEHLVMHGYPEIGHIEGYAPHMQSEETRSKMEHGLSLLGIQLGEAGALPASIAGRTAEFRPNMRWNPHAQHRTSTNRENIEYDVAKGFENYIGYMADIIYHTDDIMKLRSMVDYYRSTYAGEEISENLKKANMVREGSNEMKRDFLEQHSAYIEGMSREQMNKAIDDFTEEQYRNAGELSRYSEMTVWLENLANIMAGKQTLQDRGMEYGMGRNMMGMGRKLMNAFARANVAGSLSSVLNQTAQIPMISTHLGPKYMAEAVGDILGGKVKREGFKERNDFIVGKMDEGTLQEMTGFDKFISAIFKPAGMMDELITTVAARGEYLRQLDDGVSEETAMRRSSDWARDVMGSRVKGERPQSYESKQMLQQMLHVFQVEAANTFDYALSDCPQEIRDIYDNEGAQAAAAKLAMALAGGLLRAFLLNRLAEETYGGTPAPFDLMGLTADYFASGYSMRTNRYLEMLADNTMEKMGGERIFGTEPDERAEEFDRQAARESLGQNVLNDVPFVQNAAGIMGWGDQTMPTVGLNDIIKGAQTAKAGIRGEDGRLGGGDTNWKQIGDGVARIAAQTIPGGRQLKKTWAGINTMVEGGAFQGYGDSAKLKYAVDGTPWNWIRAAAFGTSALGQTDDYYLKDGKTLPDAQTYVWRNLREKLGGGDAGEEAYKAVMEYRRISGDKNATSTERSVNRRNWINGLNVDDATKLDIWKALEGDGDEEGKRYLNILDLLANGNGGQTISYGEVTGLFNAYQELYGNDDLSATEKATEFARMVDEEAERKGWSEELVGRIRNTWRFWQMTPAEPGTYDRMTDAGLSTWKAAAVQGVFGRLKPEDGKDSVTKMQKIAALGAMDLSEEDRWKAAASLTDDPTKETNKDGDLTEYGKLVWCRENGMSYEDYVGYREEGILDGVVRYGAYMDFDTAAEVTMELNGLKPEGGKNSVTNTQKEIAVAAMDIDEEYKMAYLEGSMAGTTYHKMEMCGEYGVTAGVWAELKRRLPGYDADRNGSYTSAEYKAAIDSMNLSRSQRAALYYMMTGSKKNVYDRGIGMKMYTEYGEWKSKK